MARSRKAGEDKPESGRCQGQTKTGKPCKRSAVGGGEFCAQHRTNHTPDGGSGWPSWADPFLEALAREMSVSHAAASVQVARRTPYNLRDRDPSFAAAWDEVWEGVIDDLEQSALRRAITGQTIRRYDKDGNLTEEREQFETSLTIFMLKTRRRKTYNVAAGDTGEAEGAGSRPVEIVFTPFQAKPK